MKTAKKTETKLGDVLLVSYNDSKFIGLCRENCGAFIIDARLKGYSQNKAVSSDALKSAFEGRYALMPELALVENDTAKEYVLKATVPVMKIVNALKQGFSVIITNYNSSLLKVIGHLIMSVKPEVRVFLKWENAETDTEGMSRQRPMSEKEFEARLEKLVENTRGFTANKAVDFKDFNLL